MATSDNPQIPRIQQLARDHAVFLFTKSWCPHCQYARETLDSIGVKYGLLEIENLPEQNQIQDGLKLLTGQRTVPGIFVGGKFLGGNSDLQKLKGSQLTELLSKAGALPSAEVGEQAPNELESSSKDQAAALPKI